MPALSSTMTEGKIVEWLKKPGEKVGRGESVLVVESDKADMDVESFNEGYLAAVLMPAGSTAPVGETIGLIVETEAEIAEAQAKAGSGGCGSACRTSSCGQQWPPGGQPPSQETGLPDGRESRQRPWQWPQRPHSGRRRRTGGRTSGQRSSGG